jgi:hypothetical protein
MMFQALMATHTRAKASSRGSGFYVAMLQLGIVVRLHLHPSRQTARGPAIQPKSTQLPKSAAKARMRYRL